MIFNLIKRKFGTDLKKGEQKGKVLVQFGCSWVKFGIYLREKEKKRRGKRKAVATISIRLQPMRSSAPLRFYLKRLW